MFLFYHRLYLTVKMSNPNQQNLHDQPQESESWKKLTEAWKKAENLHKTKSQSDTKKVFYRF